MVIQKNGELKILEGKSKPILSVAGCLEYIALSDRFRKGIFGPFTLEEEIEFQNQAKTVLKEMGIPLKNKKSFGSRINYSGYIIKYLVPCIETRFCNENLR
ncbi:hypothetical protein LEP1GSC116_0616 [Leptospira interrogans serovar Icterohaemorrhagiae str. Verdun HP]|uniref:Uncharacterized protein n=1 Tax=Leptospira interrogans serovar Icterohaemorrhagiae str. Verdun HP TaxID=1049910 RepID=M6RIB7_LEPIR|nr:hypothetical protein LEP1GSC116_0616 [Leptospira interrogans serovar Icterohaemorrhagiae str. Verdun HP]